MNFNNFKGGPRNLALMILFFAISLAVLTRLTDYSRTTQTMSYATFLNAVESDQVKSVHIVGQEAYGVLHDGKRFEAVIADNPQNWEILKAHKVDYSVGAPANQLSFWYFLLFLGALAGIAAIIYFIRQSRGSGASNIFSMGKSKVKTYMPSQIKVGFDSVAGAKEAKDALQDVVDFLKNPEKYRRLGAKLPRGVLLVGEPGNGKTLLAKAVAGEANCPFLSISGSDFIEVFVGVGAARIRDLFAQARKNAPSIIFIDEIDAIGRQRGTGLGGGHDEREQTLNQLLTEMDGFDSSGIPVVIIAATNIPEVLDKALLRPGRFDRRVDVPFPDEQAREQILRIHSRNVKVDAAVDLAALASKTAGFSGSDLANLVNQAAVHATKNNRETVTQADFDAAYEMIVSSNEATSTSNNSGSALMRISSKAKMYTPNQIKVTFADVAGMPEAKEELQDVIDFLKNPDKYRKLGAQLTRGVLMVGDPGNGKTLLAKAVAGEANCPFFSASGSEFVEMYVGVGAARVRDLFAQARKHAPCIIFVDEIDAIGGQRHNSFNEERDQTLNQLLVEMDGFESSKTPIVIIGATNRPDIFDKALTRPGRLDRRVEVPYPDVTCREQILNVHAKNKNIDPAVDFAKIARGMPGASGAMLAHLINEALIIAAKSGKSAADIDDFDQARDKIILGKERKTLVRKEEELKRTAFHEAGHALVRLLLPGQTDPLYKLTIIARGPALGVTHFLPEDDKVSENKEQMLATIMCCLGGRIAEELVFNEVSTGAHSDFESATEVARRMVCFYGMSEDLGPVIYKPSGWYKYSEHTAQRIDDEVRRIVKQCYEKTVEILKTNRDKLDLLAKTLIEKETLFANEVYELLRLPPRADHSIR